MKKLIIGLQNDWLAYLFGIMGILLIAFPETFTGATPYMLGIGLIVKAIVGIISVCKYKEETKAKAGNIVIDVVLGCAILFHNANAIGAIGAFWAMASLHEVSEEITEAFENRKFSLFRMIASGITVTLAVMLLFAPFDHFSFHVRILGLEILSSVFVRKRRIRQVL